MNVNEVPWRRAGPRGAALVALLALSSCEEPVDDGNEDQEFRVGPTIITSAATTVNAGQPLVPLTLTRPQRSSSQLAVRARDVADFLGQTVPTSVLQPWFNQVYADRYRTHFQSLPSYNLAIEFQPYFDYLVLTTQPAMQVTRSTGVTPTAAENIARDTVQDLGDEGIISGATYGLVSSGKMVVSGEGTRPHIQGYIFHFKRFEHGFMIRNAYVEVHVQASTGDVTRLAVAQVNLASQLAPEPAQISSQVATDRARQAIASMNVAISSDLEAQLGDPLPAYQLPIDDESATVRPEMHVRWSTYREDGPVGRGESGSIGFKSASAFQVRGPTERPLLCKTFVPGTAVTKQTSGATTNVTVQESYALMLASADRGELWQCEHIRLTESNGTWTLMGVRPGELALALGFQNGDKDIKVCDWTGGVLGQCFEIEGADAVGQAFTALITKRRFRVTLKRAGQTHTLYYQVT